MGNVEIKRLRILLPLFEKFLLFWKDNMDFTNGLCWTILLMNNHDFFSCKEYSEMEIYIKEKNPAHSQEVKFWSFKKHKSFVGRGYWWNLDDEGFEQRTKFIEVIIEDIKEKLKTAKDGTNN